MMKEKYKSLNSENLDIDLNRYFNTKTLKRLNGKGLFCGMDFTSIDKVKPNNYYSRFDHCVNVCNTAYKLSKDKKTALTGLFHDVGTLSFSHVNSFKKGDALTQENDELNIKNVLLNDEELLTYLDDDKISIDDVSNPKKYSLIDKKIPTLCLDRVDGIFATCIFWSKTHSIKDIKELYYMLVYLNDLKNINYDSYNDRLQDFNGELVINDEYSNLSLEDFFKAVNSYSSILLSKEDRYMMELLGLCLKYYEDIGIITEKDLFYLSEKEIIEKILLSNKKDVLEDILSIDKVSYGTLEDNNITFISKPKIRQANPLCLIQNNLGFINDFSDKSYYELNDLDELIKLTDKPINANLSKSTIKILSKYQKK